MTSSSFLIDFYSPRPYSSSLKMCANNHRKRYLSNEYETHPSKCPSKIWYSHPLVKFLCSVEGTYLWYKFLNISDHDIMIYNLQIDFEVLSRNNIHNWFNFTLQYFFLKYAILRCVRETVLQLNLSDINLGTSNKKYVQHPQTNWNEVMMKNLLDLLVP